LLHCAWGSSASLDNDAFDVVVDIGVDVADVATVDVVDVVADVVDDVATAIVIDATIITDANALFCCLCW